MKTLKEQGFTLLELMIVVLIIAVVVAIAAPNFANVTRKNKIVAATNELTGLLQYAKSTALVNNMPVVVCPVTASVSGSITTYACVTDDDGFNAATSIGALKYTSGSKTELARIIYLPSSVMLKKAAGEDNENSIAFFPDSSSGIHGVGDNYNYFAADGSYAGSNTIRLSNLSLPSSTNSVSWLIKSKTAMADNKCNLISISNLGQSSVEVKKGSDCE